MPRVCAIIQAPFSPQTETRSDLVTVNPPTFSEAEIEAIGDRLRRGQFLDDHYREVLFRPAREALLAYAGKESRGSILASTMGVPLQPVKRFGANGAEWTNKLVFGDNLQVLKRLLELKTRGGLRNADGSHGVRLCYIDPPFATKREFRGKKGQLAYRDRVAGAEFIEFLRRRLVFIHELLADDGALYLHLDTNKVHYMKVLLDEVFGPQNFRTEIIWKRSTAHSDTRQGRAQHGRIHDSILFFTKSDNWVWNPVHTAYDESYVEQRFVYQDEDGRKYKDADLTAAKPGGDTSYLWHVKAPAGTTDWVGDPDGEWEKPRRGWVYKAVPPSEGRYWAYSWDNFLNFHWENRILYFSTGTPRLKQYADELEGVSLQDLWTDIPPINSQAMERLGYPTQKPVALLDRIIRSSTNQGDLVLDCFAGAGTTAVAAELLDRRWIAVDSGKLAVYFSQRRLLSLTLTEGKKVEPREAKPFDVCHAGLYDNNLIEKLDFQHFESFTLELFGARGHPHEIAGVPMAGTRKGGSVHLFPWDQTDALMGEDYIQSLHERIGNKVSGAVYVIAPKNHCDPGMFRDVFELGRCTYFILQVPYSVIQVLHEREFWGVGQPVSLSEVNDAIDSYGFDFIELPEAKVEFRKTGELLIGQINEFRRGGLDPDDFKRLEDKGRTDLALVLVDTAYDGEAFKVEHHAFGEDLCKAKWRFEVPMNGGSEALVILMDTHGNELHQIVDLHTVKATK